MKYRFAAEALAEFIAAGQFYNRRLSGLGDEFADEIEIGIRNILSAPHAWRCVEDDVRRYLIQRFPYGIYYTVTEDCVDIWAVKHLHRDPDYWQERRH
ncbi:type II toxin-antitoxin system RelE/ParE family toxin [Actomonas aquatica]|uniref:Plasmid stabilization protein n=1 Tax=Actomonas aquatica TaxID=2866162 RepID=A0ABZ1CDK3_9BACT|nr:type II toxin-antitoxin system RelE/ParE family toxin [Opitutus sp. WL0086]WRQ89568.1 hypothetical protein K1X11_009120 [Opitutus sp. WL0086]